jgi:hypothetical protein
MYSGLYLAARDHLEQADAILSRATEDELATRMVIRYVVTVLNEKVSKSVLAENVVMFADFKRDRPDGSDTTQW